MDLIKTDVWNYGYSLREKQIFGIRIKGSTLNLLVMRALNDE
uniref:Uncharacterized protein n=1 Tax=Onchocerca volvulus TaxID=6282 RepID=A0A8R1TS58_ONCVO